MITYAEKTAMKAEAKTAVARLLKLNDRARARNAGVEERLKYERVLLAKSRKFGKSERSRYYMRKLGGDVNQYEIPDFVKILMSLTAFADERRRRHRHMRALQYAAKKNIKPKDLEWFLGAQGGHKGCAEKYKEEYGASD